jgi:hypothetical protein
MAGVRFAALQSRPLEFLDFTSLTLDEFQQLVPPSRSRSKPGWKVFQSCGSGILC